MTKAELWSQKLLPLAVALTTALALGVASTVARADAVAEAGTSETVFANWSVTDSTGCLLTQALVTASEASLRGDGTIGPSAEVHAFQYDFCTGAFLYGDGVTLSPILNIDQSLQAASLQGEVNLCGASSVTGFGCFTVSMDLTWGSTSAIQRVNETDQFRMGDTIVIAHVNGSTRDAIALGSLTGGGVSWVEGDSQQAFIGLTLSNGIEITHN